MMKYARRIVVKVVNGIRIYSWIQVLTVLTRKTWTPSLRMKNRAALVVMFSRKSDTYMMLQPVF
ncbi:hypothetical protein AZE42_13890, partial [Rhizopogon vesiculosus]